MGVSGHPRNHLMRPRDYTLLTCLGLLAISSGLMIWNAGDNSTAPPPSPKQPSSLGNETTNPTQEAGPAVGQLAPTAPVEQSEVRAERPNTESWTSGQIYGDIPLAASIVNRIESISIVIDEIRNLRSTGPRPFRKVVPVKLGIGTPTFHIRDIPFSSYAYSVRVHSPGLNGAQQTVAITKDQPLADNLKLPLTPGAPFSLRLGDQDRAPIAFTKVLMVPTGAPLGRPNLHGESDNFGSLIFENVLAGDYEVLVGEPDAPLVDPAPILTVQPGVIMARNGAIQPQGEYLTVPRGVPLTIRVYGPGGYPLESVMIRAQHTEKKILTELKAETDVRGEAFFPRLLGGVWQIDAQLKNFTNRTRQVTIDSKNPPGPIEFNMRRLR
ncbi:MAG: hypothetical protein VYE77_03275 [Planctomycetota bacterium]|nr:hypothetical protein [Planctomycetota bacterium]